MNKGDKNNVYNLIESYIFNEKKLPESGELIKYNPVYVQFFTYLQVDKKDLEGYIEEFYFSKLDSFVKEKEKFPFYGHLLDFNEDYKKIFGLFEKNDFEKLMLSYFRVQINTNSKTKSKSCLKDKYIENKKLFEEFFILNLDKKNLENKKFHEIGAKFQDIIIDVENYVVGRMEGGQFGGFSSSTRDKLVKYIKSLFPLYLNIGVKVRKR